MSVRRLFSTSICHSSSFPKPRIGDKERVGALSLSDNHILLTATPEPLHSETETMELPTEIWALVAAFLGDKDLHYIRGINRVLHHLYLDNKYRRVFLDFRNHIGMDLLR
jgi:hypothetical protein